MATIQAPVETTETTDFRETSSNTPLATEAIQPRSRRTLKRAS